MKKMVFTCLLASLSIIAHADLVQDRLSLAAGYVGENTNFKDLDGNEKLDGFFINGVMAIDSNIGLYAEYANQKDRQLKFDEITLGAQYRFYDNNYIYMSAGLGLGYMWSDQTLYTQNIGPNAKLKLNYVTLPLNAEIGYKLTKNTSIYSDLGYKWLFNDDSKVCIENIGRFGGCTKLDENADGLTYKVGLRYSF